MKLENRTRASVALLRTGSPTGSRHALGCVVARVLFAIGDDGRATPVDGASWPVGPDPVATPFGASPGDRPFYAGGVDVLLAGSVYARGGVPEPRFDVELEIGRTFRRRIAVSGPRTWVRREGRLVASEPKPIGVMRLAASRAFGGRAVGPEGTQVPFAWNPDGVGFYLDADAAEGGALPNLEHPARLVAAWTDRPVPVGLGMDPSGGALGAWHAIDHPAVIAERERIFSGRAPAAEAPPAFDGSVTVDRLLPSLFNQAHPEMVIEAAKAPRPGDVVRLSRARRGGEDLLFALPDRQLHAFVQLESRGFLVPLVLDQIGIVAGASQLLLGFRAVFEYAIARGERRIVTLHDGPRPSAVPAGYRAVVANEWDEHAWWRKDRALDRP